MVTAALPSPLIRVRSGPWKNRRIASPLDAIELRVPAADLDERTGLLVGLRVGVDVYRRTDTSEGDGWQFFHRDTSAEPTGFVVFAFPKEKAR